MRVPVITQDRELSARERRLQSRVRTAQAQRTYEAQLRKVGRLVGKLTDVSPPGDLGRLLKAYAEALVPWAQRTAWRMLLDVDDSSLRTWRTLSEAISFERRREINETPVGATLHALLDEQVKGITSIPLKAAQRVEALALESLTTGTRAKEIAAQIANSGEVAKSDAMRLARTSVTGAATALVQARAQYAGSVAYVWETARDSTVRPSHRAMQGKLVRWDDPPTIDGYTAHAGAYEIGRAHV
jgi:SPP1 gp7 family putative phage head morphogenesis protein